MSKTKIVVERDDIAVLVKPSGESQVFVPYRGDGENELTHEQLHKMLKEIRNLELAFTEMVNETFVEDSD